MPLPFDLPDGTALLSAVGGAVTSFLVLRRRVSRVKVEVVKDQAEVNLIALLQSERDRAITSESEARKNREEDAKLIGELETKVAYLTEINVEMKKQIVEMRKEVQALRKEMLSMRGDAK